MTASMERGTAGQPGIFHPGERATAGGPPLGGDVVAKVAEFAALTPRTSGQGSAPLDRLFEVTVTMTAELGRTTLSIADILKLSPGSVLELDRAVSEPVDLLVPGVRLARGEVVVVDD